MRRKIGIEWPNWRSWNRDDWWSSKPLDFYDSSVKEAAVAAAPLFAQAFWHELMGEVDKQDVLNAE